MLSFELDWRSYPLIRECVLVCKQAVLNGKNVYSSLPFLRREGLKDKVIVKHGFIHE
jgi:hypothetical protein